ncbi:hypothetical protein [Bradyrhizobium sp. SZCCHNR3118]|uniref:hypothetical protein n=1 Tax=Bradyrhizobium sp. SZCCHNR3118 TaxID=3057468 RepID=UPI002916ED29|nr:hypothetical protein [Bradyrhizobium sp. SZCCHNR3118]
MARQLKEWGGFTAGQNVTVLIETMGADHLDVEHTMPPGSAGVIDSIDRYDNDQGVVFTVVIPVDGESAIVNAFDELDGPIEQMLAARTGESD